MHRKQAIRLKRNPLQSIGRWFVIVGALAGLAALIITEPLRKKEDIDED